MKTENRTSRNRRLNRGTTRGASKEHVSTSQDRSIRSSYQKPDHEIEEEPREFVSISKIDKMTEERKYKLFEIKQDHEKFRRAEEQFKKQNKQWPPSEHYIYLPPEKKQKVKTEDEDGFPIQTDKIDDEWCQLNVFLPILQEIIQPDHEKVKDIYLENQKKEIEEEYEGKMMRMARQIEQADDMISEDSEDDSISKYSKKEPTPASQLKLPGVGKGGKKPSPRYTMAQAPKMSSKQVTKKRESRKEEKLRELEKELKKSFQKEVKAIEFPTTFISDINTKPLSEWISEQSFVSLLPSEKGYRRINHIRVHEQQCGSLCGFHAYWNAKCMVRAILALKKKQIEVLRQLIYLKSPSKFQSSYQKTCQLILNCKNHCYINKTDQRNLIRKQNPLERNMLNYLLFYDPEIKTFKNNKAGVTVFFRPFLIGFGMMQMTYEQVKEFNYDLELFHNSKQESVFVIFIGALNHWVTLVVHKTIHQVQTKRAANPFMRQDRDSRMSSDHSSSSRQQQFNFKMVDKYDFYLLDSTNFEHMNTNDEQIPKRFAERIAERMRAGLRMMNHFTMKMIVQSIFDLRRSISILQDVFIYKTPLNQYFIQGHLQNKLYQFHQQSSELIEYYEKNYANILKYLKQKENKILGVEKQASSTSQREVRKVPSTQRRKHEDKQVTASISKKVRVMRFKAPLDRFYLREQREGRDSANRSPVRKPFTRNLSKDGSSPMGQNDPLRQLRNVSPQQSFKLDNTSGNRFSVMINKDSAATVQAKKVTSQTNVRKDKKEMENAMNKIEVGKSFHNPKWSLEEDFLGFYYMLPIDIDFSHLEGDDDFGGGTWKLQERQRSTSMPMSEVDQTDIYKFLVEQDTVDQQKKVYRTFVDFLRNGVRVKDIEHDTLRAIQAFGADNAFFAEDRMALISWCQAVLFSNLKMLHRRKQAHNDSQLIIPKKTRRETVMSNKSNRESQLSVVISEALYDDSDEPTDNFEDIEERHHLRFSELATLCRKIMKKAAPKDVQENWAEFVKKEESLFEADEVTRVARLKADREAQIAKEEQERKAHKEKRMNEIKMKQATRRLTMNMDKGEKKKL